MRRVEQHVFVVPAESLNIFSQWIKKLLPKDNDAAGSPDREALYRLVLTTDSFQQVLSTSPTEQWMDRSTLSQHIIKQEEQIHSESLQTESLDACLHGIADSLPCSGSSVYLYVFLHAADLDDNSFVPLAGAALRLSQWHRSYTVIVRIDSELSALAHELVSLVSGQIVPITECPQLAQVTWSGRISVTDLIKNDGIVYPGFSFHCPRWNVILKQAFPSSRGVQIRKQGRKEQMAPSSPMQDRICCGQAIEVLQEVDLRTFPLFLLTPWTFNLQTFDQRSCGLAEYVHENTLTGLLARIPMNRHLGEIVSCGDTKHMSTSAWKEHIIDSTSTSSNSPRMEGDHSVAKLGYLHFLILPCLYPQPPPSPSEKSPKSLMVRVLLTAKQMARHLLAVAKQQDLFEKWIPPPPTKRDGYKEEAKRMKSLPVIKVENLCSTVKQLHSYKELTSHSNPEDESNGKIQLKQMFEVMHKTDQTMGDVLLQEEKNDTHGATHQWVAEAANELSKCPEWISLMAENSENAWPVDSSTGSTPRSHTAKSKENSLGKHGSKDFSVELLLSLFKEDGKETEESRSLREKLPETSGLSFSRKSQSGLELPKAKPVTHDIYPYLTEEDLDMEKRYAHIRDGGHFQDTQSSFMTPQKKYNRPFRPILPTRSSPRTKLSNPRMVSSQSSSSKVAMEVQQTFKYPHSVHGSTSSQRKRPASSLTPDAEPPRPAKLKRISISSHPSTASAASPVSRGDITTTASTSSEQMYKRVPFTTVLESEHGVRRSPRKLPGLQSGFGESSKELDLKPKDSSKGGTDQQRDSRQTESMVTSDGSGGKMKRSERHMMRLKRIIAHVLKEKGVEDGDPIYDACSKNLLNVSIVLLKTLPNSKNLTNEMKSVVFEQVQQIINLEKRRSGISL